MKTIGSMAWWRQHRFILLGTVGVLAVLSTIFLTARRPAPAIAAYASVPDAPGLVTDGNIYAAVASGDIMYLGGDFAQLGRNSPFVELVSAASGSFERGMALVDGDVDAVASDGNGGWFLGGSFETIGGTDQAYLAHITASGSLDTGFTPPTLDGQVDALVASGSTLYVGGDFSGSLLALNTSTGEAVPGFTVPDLSSVPIIGSVKALAVAGNTLFIGGSGTQYLAAFNATTGASMGGFTVPAAIDGNVWALAASGSTLYVGGQFSTFLAALDTTTGTAVPGFTPDASIDHAVKSLAVSGSTLYAGGQFDTYLAALDATSGSALPGFTVPENLDGEVDGLAVKGNILAIGGQFHDLGGNYLYGNFAGLDATTGAVLPGFHAVDAQVRAIAVLGDDFLVGGSFSAGDIVQRFSLAAVSISTGRVLDFNPSLDDTVYALALDGQNVYAGGAFTTAGDATTRNHLAAFNGLTGASTSFDPDLDGDVRSLTVKDGILYAGGDFTTVNADTTADTRNHIAAFRLDDGSLTSFDPDVNNSVLAMVASGSTLYAGGTFTTVNGGTLSRFRLASFSTIGSGSATIFDPNVADGQVRALAINGSTLYAGGTFTFVGWDDPENGPFPVQRLAAFHADTGIVTDLNGIDTGLVFGGAVGVGGSVDALAIGSGQLIVGGEFTDAVGEHGQDITRKYGASFSLVSGLPRNFDPEFSGPVYALSVVGDKLLAAGGFKEIGTTGGSYGLFSDLNETYTTPPSIAVNGSNPATIAYGDQYIDVAASASDAVDGNISRIVRTTDPVDVYTPGTYTVTYSVTDGGGLTATAERTVIVQPAITAEQHFPNTANILRSATDGNVRDIVHGTNSTYYAAGNFTEVGGIGNSFTTTSEIAQGNKPKWPKFNGGGPYSVIPDGSGGWYAGGVFTYVGEVPRSNLVHFLADGTVDPVFNPVVDGAIYDIVASGSRLYIAGDFNHINGIDKSKVAVLDATTGAFVPVNFGVFSGATYHTHPVHSVVNAILLHGNTLYVGGDFTSVNSTPRSYLAAFDTTTGTLLPFDPEPNGQISSMTADSSRLYVGGNFTVLTNPFTVLNYIAAFTFADGLADPTFDPAPNDAVYKLTVVGDTLYAGGVFTEVNEDTTPVSRNLLAAFDTTAGDVTAFDAGLSGDAIAEFIAPSEVLALDHSGGDLYVGGSFTDTNGHAVSEYAVVNATTGAYVPSTTARFSFGPVECISVSDDDVAIAGFGTINSADARGVATFNTDTDEFLPFSIGVSNSDPWPIVNGLAYASASNTLYLGGMFDHLYDGTTSYTRSRLAAINLTTNTVAPFAPVLDGDVDDVVIGNGTLYIAGAFTTVNGQPRNGIAAFNLSTGLLTDFDPNLNSGAQVQRILLDGTTLYAGGVFSTVNGGTPRDGLAAFDTVTGTATGFTLSSPLSLGGASVSDLFLHDGKLYVAATFTLDEGGGIFAHPDLLALDAVTGTYDTNFQPLMLQTVNSISVTGDHLYVAGDFTTAGGPVNQSRNYVASLNATTGAVGPFNPPGDTPYYKVLIDGNVLILAN